MKDIQKIKEFFSQPMKESLTGGYPHTKTSGEGFEKITITEPIDDATKNKMIQNFRAAGWDAKPNNGGGITAIKKSIMEAKKETAIDMAKKQLDALGVKYEMSDNKFRPFKAIYKPINKSDRWYDKFDEIVDLFNLASAVKQSMNEAPQTKYSVKPGKKGFSVIKTSTGSEITSFDTEEKAKQHTEKLNKMKFIPKEKFNEAKEEDAVDTITMDIPLFLRMLEYSREDAAQDVDLHDVTEKANTLGKERGILSMEDYNEIVGAAEEIEEGFYGKGNKRRGLQNQSKLSSAEYQMAKKLKSFKASDWKWNADEDLYTKVVKEATDYMKRRKSEDDYATKKPKQPVYTGKTDYQKRREAEKKLAETIFSKLKEAKSTPCWKGYEQKGMNKKDGRQVPNCVPKN